MHVFRRSVLLTTRWPSPFSPWHHHNCDREGIITRESSRWRCACLYSLSDQQLYKVTIDILFHQPSYFKSVIPVLGGMHMLMNFIHTIAIIMAGSGMKEILAVTFGSIDKMLSGKKYPQNFRVLRMLVEEMLRSVVLIQGVTSICSPHRITRSPKMWTVDIVSHHNDELLSWRTWRGLSSSSRGCRSHVTLFPFCRFHNYALYAAFDVHHMKGLDPVMMKTLQYGAFMRHIPGIYYSTWTDMYIERTYMRLGYGPTGAI